MYSQKHYCRYISALVFYIHTSLFGSMLTRLQRIFFLLLRKTCDITLLLMWTTETCYRFFWFFAGDKLYKNKKLLQITYFFQWRCFDHIVFICFDIDIKWLLDFLFIVALIFLVQRNSVTIRLCTKHRSDLRKILLWNSKSTKY